MNEKNQQLAEAIVKSLNVQNTTGLPMQQLTKCILPLIAEFKKEVAGEAWDAAICWQISPVLLPPGRPAPPDRATYIDNINK